jgi:hypothetical protein
MAPRKKTVEELKREAIAELERRGYGIRGKTPAQIRQILRRSPKKPKLIPRDK